MGRPADALTTCRTGRAHYVEDAETLRQEASALRALGELAGAIACMERLVGGSEPEHFSSAVTGLRGYIGRTKLAGYLTEAGRRDEARGQYRPALSGQPEFIDALFALGELGLTGRHLAGLGG